MNNFRALAPALGVACLVIGSLAALSNGGTTAATTALGHSLITAGAIIIAAAIIGAALTGSGRKQ
jgi:hypothetical protein